LGAFADYVVAAEDALVPIPDGVVDEAAAALPMAGLTALQGLVTHGRLAENSKVLVIGASGGVGSYAVQIATALGARVTAVCSTGNIDYVTALGAQDVIDYTTTDLVRVTDRYDLILQLAGQPPSRLRRLLTRGGALLLIAGDSKNGWLGPIPGIAAATLGARFRPERVATYTMRPDRRDLRRLTSMLANGELRATRTTSIDLADVPDAIEGLRSTRVAGKTVVRGQPQSHPHR
jgi:NADPH:quinone reductase-like Zn-dependent oxidoreductase